MKLIFILFSASIIFLESFSQSNCSNPAIAIICPASTFTAQTNAGMLDDAPPMFNSLGEDLVYEITSATNVSTIHVAILHATGNFRMSLQNSFCTSTFFNSRNLLSGNSNITFFVTPGNTFYLWIDALSTITFDISIGGDTAQQFVNIPNTQGLMVFDSCASNPFNPSKPFFEVSYNGIAQHDPMTLSPLGISGLMCISIYIANTTGVSGPGIFNFSFDQGGYGASIPVNFPFAGYYNSGNWNIVNSTGNNHSFRFDDAAGLGRGDFTGVPNSCLRYDFCFDILPLSNNPAMTNVNVNIFSDNFGMGYDGWIRLGCCPANYSNCNGIGSGSGTSNGGAMGLGMGFNDPGNSLPVALKYFNAIEYQRAVRIEWISSTEVNNDYFTVDRSIDGIMWNEIARVKGAGNSSMDISYETEDLKPVNGTSYYRLKQTDFDGAVTVFEPVRISVTNDPIIYPIPTNDELHVELSENGMHSIQVINSYGEVMLSEISNGKNQLISVRHLPHGIYLLRVISENKDVYQSRIAVVK